MQRTHNYKKLSINYILKIDFVLKVKNMRTKDFVQTIILICVFITIILFGFIYYLLLNEAQNSLIKDTLSLVASFFGGISTLAAAYVATFLFNDWKVQQNFLNKLQLINKTTEAAGTFLAKISKVVEFVVQIKHEAKDIMFDGDKDGLKMKKINELYILLNNEKMEYVRSFQNLESHIFRYGVSWKDPTFPEMHKKIQLMNNILQESFQNYELATHVVPIFQISDEILLKTKHMMKYIQLEMLPILDKKMAPDSEEA
jgi:hypothetical protein